MRTYFTSRISSSFDILWTGSNYFCVICTTCFNVLYFLKIANFSNPIFLWNEIENSQSASHYCTGGTALFLYMSTLKKNVIYLFFERERARASGGRADREGDTQSKAGSRLRAVSTAPDMGLKLMNCKIMTWAEVWCLIDWATQAPLPMSPLEGSMD